MCPGMFPCSVLVLVLVLSYAVLLRDFAPALTSFLLFLTVPSPKYIGIVKVSSIDTRQVLPLASSGVSGGLPFGCEGFTNQKPETWIGAEDPHVSGPLTNSIRRGP